MKQSGRCWTPHAISTGRGKNGSEMDKHTHAYTVPPKPSVDRRSEIRVHSTVTNQSHDTEKQTHTKTGPTHTECILFEDEMTKSENAEVKLNLDV